MIRIEFSGICQDCYCADLKLEPVTYESGSGNVDKVKWFIECRHEDACMRMYHHMRNTKGSQHHGETISD